MHIYCPFAMDDGPTPFGAKRPRISLRKLNDVERAECIRIHFIEGFVGKMIEDENRANDVITFSENMDKAWGVPEDADMGAQCAQIANAAKRALRVLKTAHERVFKADTNVRVYDDAVLLAGAALSAGRAAHARGAL